jgi:hypothetical protein
MSVNSFEILFQFSVKHFLKFFYHFAYDSYDT